MHTANEGPVRIQYECLVSIYVFTEMKLLFPKQNFNFLSPSSYQGWAKLVLIALERYSVALKRLTFNSR